jgi:hypothetical protein
MPLVGSSWTGLTPANSVPLHRAVAKATTNVKVVAGAVMVTRCPEDRLGTAAVSCKDTHLSEIARGMYGLWQVLYVLQRTYTRRLCLM